MRFFSELLRLPLRLIPPETVVPILSGPLRGWKWIAGSSVARCWLGTYERQKLAKMAEILKAGDVVYDIGAQAGYHAMVAARCVGPTGSVYAFEPSPRNQAYIRRNLAINGVSRVELVEAAVCDAEGRVAFDAGAGFMAGHVSPSGGISVRCVSLDSWLDGGGVPPNLIKIDVEGAELRVLQGAARMLSAHHPAIMLDTHDFLRGECLGLHEACVRFLRDAGYHRIAASVPKRFAGQVVAQ
ncbi:MAG TPA: FkbM family methyltransferase [Bryobacteraceae bacterium]|nr:FkbM family methyltransferase [Bryobacteraceae bacterium]